MLNASAVTKTTTAIGKDRTLVCLYVICSIFFVREANIVFWLIYCRSRWWHRRQAFLQKEQRYDDLDREEEKEKLAEAAKKAAQEVEAAAAAVANAAAEAGAAMEVDSAAIATPSASQDKDVEMNEAYGSGSISSTAEEAEMNDASGLNIPSDPQELWNWPVQWSVMEANDGLILKEKIMPFATKIVVELLGVPEEDLTKYVVDHIRQRKPPQDLISELRDVSFFCMFCYCVGL